MRKFFLLIISSFFIQTSFAQWSDDSLSNLAIKDGLGIDEVVPLQATTSYGYTYVSWFESNGGDYKLMMQLLDVQGNKLWGDDGLLVSDHPTGSALYVYDLAADHSGNAIVAFQDERNGDLMPVVYKLDAEGDFMWGPDGIVLHDTSATFELSPAIGVLSNNDVIIAWNATFSKSGIAYQKISKDGELQWGSDKTIKSNSKGYSRPDFANTNDLSFVMSYVQQTGNFPYTNTIFANRYDSSGSSLWSAATKVSTYSTSFFEFPVVISDQKNGAFIAFNSGEPGNPAINDAFVQHIDSNGSDVLGFNGAEIASITDNHRLISGISYLADSDQLCASLKVLDNAQGEAGIYVQKLDDGGNRFWGDTGYELLPLSSTNYHEPFGLQLADDSWMIAYTEGGVTSQEFKVVKFDLNGNVIWNNTISAVSSNKYDATMGSFMNDQLVVVWEDERNGSGVYAQNISGEGELGVIATSVTEQSALFAKVYPSLFSDKLTVDLRQITNAEFTITDISGRIASVIKLHEGINQIQVSSLPEGIYFYSIRSGEFLQSGALSKQ